MGRNPLAQARVEPDMKQAIEDYADRHNLTQSEATRRLIMHGLAREGYRTDGTASPLTRLASTTTMLLGAALMLLSTAPIAVALTNTAPTIMTVIGTILAALGVLTVWTATLAQIALARPLRGLLPFTKESETA